MELTFIFVALVQFSSCVSSISTPPLIPSPNDPDVNLDLPDFNKPCNKTTCKPGQFCTNGLCACANPSYEIYNKVTGRCDRVVGAVCTDHNVCAKGAVCIRKHFERQTPSSASLYGYRVTEITANICRCPAGWVENINHGCDLAYGQICGGEDLVGVKCDRNGDLVCRQGKCGCPNVSDKYNAPERKCLKGIGLKLRHTQNKKFVKSTPPVSVHKDGCN
ncbi:uncharacterized protein LOC118439146 [Folsomia candida]|uniref:uncharacterized protein LOC118439146 n=1 Tax=Folsomia candida TaxID=158441 RepID=UPI0016053873|nr:uncharacterized protein LOC118439146 [Folsomia candida]